MNKWIEDTLTIVLALAFVTVIAYCTMTNQAHAQTSLTLGEDLAKLKAAIFYCITENHGWIKDSRGNTTLFAKPDTLKWCEGRALELYKQQVDSEERLIEGMTKSCCPYIKQPPNRAPYYREKKEYKNVQTDIDRMLAQFEAGLREGR